MRFPGPPHSFPTKDEVADYLEAYAERFDLRVRLDVRVDRLAKHGERLSVKAGELHFEADNVVVAMGIHQVPSVPDFAEELNSDIVQLHSTEYRNPSQLQEGGVLLVGTGIPGLKSVWRLHAGILRGFRVETSATFHSASTRSSVGT